MTTRAITVRPPWTMPIAEAAALRALGVDPKLRENRGRRIADKHIGEDIAIHAGLTWSREGETDPRVLRAWKAFADGIGCCRDTPHPALAAIGDRRSGCVGHAPTPQPGLWIEQGAIVAVATLTDCHQARPDASSPTGFCCAPWGDRWYATARGTVPAWHLVLANVRRLPGPVQAKGSLAVPWRLPEAVAEAMRVELDKAGVP